jgi:hypothetical protein
MTLKFKPNFTEKNNKDAETQSMWLKIHNEKLL